MFDLREAEQWHTNVVNRDCVGPLRNISLRETRPSWLDLSRDMTIRVIGSVGRDRAATTGVVLAACVWTCLVHRAGLMKERRDVE